MNKELIREIIYFIIAVIISILAIKLFIWLLPIILIVLLAGFIYRSMKRRKIIKDYTKYAKESENKKSKNKKIVIIEDESNNDK